MIHWTFSAYRTAKRQLDEAYAVNTYGRPIVAGGTHANPKELKAYKEKCRKSIPKLAAKVAEYRALLEKAGQDMCVGDPGLEEMIRA